MNHAAVSVNDKIFSFGGYCTGDNYKDVRPIDIFVLNTGSVGVKLNFKFDVRSPIKLFLCGVFHNISAYFFAPFAGF